MRSKKRATAGVTNHNPSHQPQLCFEGEILARFLKSVHREIESVRTLNKTLPLKLWIKQQFAVGVNEVTRGLERMPPTVSGKNADDSGYFQAILLASDCNPRSLTKHLPALAASRNVPLITVRDKKEASLKLGELIKVKTAIAIGVKAKGNSVNLLVQEALTDDKMHSIEDEA